MKHLSQIHNTEPKEMFDFLKCDECIGSSMNVNFAGMGMNFIEWLYYPSACINI